MTNTPVTHTSHGKIIETGTGPQDDQSPNLKVDISVLESNTQHSVEDISNNPLELISEDVNGDALSAALQGLQQLEPDQGTGNHNSNDGPLPPSLDDTPVTPSHDVFSEPDTSVDDYNTEPVLGDQQSEIGVSNDSNGHEEQDPSLLNI